MKNSLNLRIDNWGWILRVIKLYNLMNATLKKVSESIKLGVNYLFDTYNVI